MKNNAAPLTRRGRPRKFRHDDGTAHEPGARARLHAQALPVSWQPPERCREPWREVFEGWGAFKLVPRVSTLEWFEENVVVNARTSDFRGKYSRNNFPYQAGVLEAFDDIEVKQISLQWAAQSGKSFLIQNLVAKIADADPSPMMFACPDEPTAQEISKERIIPTVEAIPRLKAKLLPEGRRDALKLDLGDCLCFMAWSGSPSTLGQRACRFIFCTELSKWSRDKSDEADPADLVRERVKAFWDSKIILEGTPTVEGICRVEALGKTANQRLKFKVPCPKCGYYQHLLFKQIKWERVNEKNDRDIAEQTAHYECLACHEKWTDADRVIALRSGVWAEENTDIPRGFKGFVCWTAGKARRRVHFDLSSIYSPVLTLGAVASEFIRCIQGEGQKKLQNFVNSWLAETWSQNVREYDWKDLKVLRIDTPAGGVPEWAAFLTAGIDCGKYCSHYTIRAWGPGGRSRLVAWGQVQNKGERIDFEAIEANILQLAFGNQGMRVALCGIDSGYKTYDVYSWVIQMGYKYGDAVRPIKGVAKGAPYWMTRQDRSGEDGTPLDEGVRLWCINDHYWKEFLTAKYSVPAGAPGAWEITIDADELYLRSLVSEVLQERQDVRGHVKYEWVVVDKTIGNHYFDCEKIAAVMADMGGWRELSIDAAQGPEVIKGAPAFQPQNEDGERFELNPDGYWPS